jgi:hypothetical protein
MSPERLPIGNRAQHGILTAGQVVTFGQVSLPQWLLAAIAEVIRVHVQVGVLLCNEYTLLE